MILFRLKTIIFKIQWKRKNMHNETMPLCTFPQELVHVGRGTYGGIKPIIYNKSFILKIGNYCSIGPNVTFVVAGDHYMNHLSTYPYKNKMLSMGLEAISKGDIIIEDDVWIGNNATVLSGVKIGQGAVVAAGAVVDKDVPPYNIVGGIPAKIIKKRFNDDIVDYLMTLDYSKLTKEMVKEHIDDLYKNIENLELKKIMGMYSWFPKK